MEAALGQQQAFAADLEKRLNDRLAEAESLRTLDAALSDRLAQEQAALAAQLAATAQPPAQDVAPSQITLAPAGWRPQLSRRWIHHCGRLHQRERPGPAQRRCRRRRHLCGGGYRDPQEQIELRRAHCGTSNYAIYEMPASQCSPPTALPWTSMHEQGLAIDFTCNGGGTVSSGDECWDWLQCNAVGYGLYNLPSEPWHWSTNGNLDFA